MRFMYYGYVCVFVEIDGVWLLIDFGIFLNGFEGECEFIVVFVMYDYFDYVDVVCFGELLVVNLDVLFYVELGIVI